MQNLKIIIGRTRPGRAADRVIPWITATEGEHGGFDVDVLDLRDWPLPLVGEHSPPWATRTIQRSPRRW